jgi:hypothetical protein
LNVNLNPPAYVSNKNLMAFDEVIDDLLDRLQDVMFSDRGVRR